MGKISLFVLLAVLIGGGVWFYRLGGPAQLDLADRLWPGKDAVSGLVAPDVPYSAHTNSPQQRYDVYLPQAAGKGGPGTDCGGQKYPSLIFFHGGSWRNGDRKSYGFVGRAFAAQGYYTFIVDYRKLPRHRFPDFVADAGEAIATIHKSLRQYGCADPQKMFLMGHSAGAHIAMLAALDPQWLTAQGSDPSIIAGVIGLAGPYDFYPFTSDAAVEAMGHWPRPEETQPIHYAQKDAPPLLLLTGDADITVKPRNSEALAKAMTALGGNAAVKHYTGVDHTGIVMAMSRPFRSKAPVIIDVAEFVAQISAKPNP